MNSYPKINIFLKIVGRDKKNYHLLASRFVKIKNIFDEITFQKKQNRNDSFEIVGDFSCDVSQNTIYKSFQELLKYCDKSVLRDFFSEHYVDVKKSIPEGSGLGGGSSNSATFLKMCNEYFELGFHRERGGC